MSLPLLHAGKSAPGLSAALDLRFALDKSLTAYRGPTPSFSRASTGTYFNSSGVLTSASINTPRFNHTYNGTSWVSRGLLVEEQRTNQLTNSNTFTSSFPGGGAQLSSSATISPDGTSNAWKIYESAAAGGSLDQRRYNVVSFSGSQSSYSIYAKAAERRRILLFVNGPDKGSWFDLISETCGNDSAYTGASQTIQNVGNGWYRCTIIVPASAGIGNLQIQILLDSGTTVAPNRVGDGSSGFYIAFAQHEVGAFPTSYIGTTSSAATRSADVCQITGTDFSGFYNQNEGSVVLEFDGAQPLPSPSPRNFPTYVTISKGNSGYDLETNSFSIFGNSDTNKIGVYASIDRVTQYEIYSTGLFSPNMTQRSSFGYAVNNFGFTNNGENVLTDTSGTNPNQMAYLHLGKSSTGTFSCHIARLRYFNKRLPNATLKLLSEPDPTLNLQFALNKSLTPVAGPAPSFSRASTGTYFNASGVLTSASINTPRFDHVYSGGQWVSRGLLLEEQRTNAFQWSEDFSNAFWTKLNASIATSSGTSPDGTNTANKITDDSTNGTHRIYRANVGTAGQPCTTSFYLKAGTARYAIVLNSDNNDWRAYAVADLQTGTITQNGVMVAATGASYIGSSITNCGDGWYRVSVSGTNQNGDANYYGQVALSNSATPGTIPSYIGTGSYIYAVMAQMELNSSFPTSYIKTTSSTVTRSADVCQITGTSFNWMWNQGEGSVVADFSRSMAGAGLADGFICGASNNPVPSYQIGQYITSGEIHSYGYNSAWIYDFNHGNQLANTVYKLATGFKSNDFASSLNGGSALTDTLGTLGSDANHMTIGYIDWSTGARLNGHIAKLIYYPARLTNTKLQQLST